MDTIQVVAAVLRDAQSRVLINRRPAGKPWADYWEFPGGKIEPRETPLEALRRELHEELALTVHKAHSWLQLSHNYPERRVHLDVWRVRAFSGTPQAREGQALAWVRPQELADWRLLPADAPIVTALQWPPHMLVTPSPGSDWRTFFAALDATLEDGVEFVQLRAPQLPEAEYAALARATIKLCREHGAHIVLNQEPGLAKDLGADGVHLNSVRLSRTRVRPLPQDFLVGASCHDESQMRQAQAAGADYLVVGPVLATPSHPGGGVLDWEGFARLAALSPLPIYAIGGMRSEHLQKIRALGGHGIAAVRSLWAGYPAASSS
jgi:8-oxo-dGTP diphosphatase